MRALTTLGVDCFRVRTLDFFLRRFLESVADLLYRGNSSLEIMEGVLEKDDDAETTEAVSLSLSVDAMNEDCDSRADGSNEATEVLRPRRCLPRVEEEDILQICLCRLCGH